MTADRALIRIDNTACDVMRDQFRALFEADHNRVAEFQGAFDRLGEFDAYVQTPLVIAGEVIHFFTPSPRMFDLYAALRLRALLALPPMDPPQV